MQLLLMKLTFLICWLTMSACAAPLPHLAANPSLLDQILGRAASSPDHEALANPVWASRMAPGTRGTVGMTWPFASLNQQPVKLAYREKLKLKWAKLKLILTSGSRAPEPEMNRLWKLGSALLTSTSSYDVIALSSIAYVVVTCLLTSHKSHAVLMSTADFLNKTARLVSGVVKWKKSKYRRIKDPKKMQKKMKRILNRKLPDLVGKALSFRENEENMNKEDWFEQKEALILMQAELEKEFVKMKGFFWDVINIKLQDRAALSAKADAAVDSFGLCQQDATAAAAKDSASSLSILKFDSEDDVIIDDVIGDMISRQYEPDPNEFLEIVTPPDPPKK